MQAVNILPDINGEKVASLSPTGVGVPLPVCTTCDLRDATCDFHNSQKFRAVCVCVPRTPPHSPRDFLVEWRNPAPRNCQPKGDHPISAVEQHTDRLGINMENTCDRISAL